MFERYKTPVRCDEGHLYTSIWVPLASLKSVRLGAGRRYQRCPVGRHWSMTAKLDAAKLTANELATASKTHDTSLF